jgi:hypothetical protein
MRLQQGRRRRCLDRQAGRFGEDEVGDAEGAAATAVPAPEPEAAAEATRLAEGTNDMATFQILELDTNTLEATETFSFNHNCEEAQ